MRVLVLGAGGETGGPATGAVRTLVAATVPSIREVGSNRLATAPRQRSPRESEDDRQALVLTMEMTAMYHATTPFPGRAARAGLWALPLYGVLLGLSTLTHQPAVEQFDAYARYVTTDVFLVSHLAASILGAGVAVLGAVAVTAFLTSGRESRLAVIGLVLTTLSNVFLAATFGSAAFVQPGIGRAHLAGTPGMPELNDDTAYGGTFVATALTATFFLVVSAVVLGTAIARSHPSLRRHGVAYAVLLPAFALSGFFLQSVQAIAGFALAAATAALAVHLPRLVGRPTSTGRQRPPVLSSNSSIER